MSIFGSILAKLGLGDGEPEEAKSGSTDSSVAAASAEAAQAAAPDPMARVDVVAKLTAMAGENSQKLNWKTSIVDLMKLLGIDSSYSARKTLAAELGCPDEKMGDSAQMNMWLHKTVLQKLSENGGNIPAELLD
jgi:hypothetical protein